jgi:hypothetical protein
MEAFSMAYANAYVSCVGVRWGVVFEGSKEYAEPSGWQVSCSLAVLTILSATPKSACPVDG